MLKNVRPHQLTVPYPLLRPRPGSPLRFTSRSRHFIGVDTHYGSSGSYLCPGEDHCEHCKKGEPPRYQGYLLGQGLDSGRIAICHLTASAAEELDELDQSTRGLLGCRMCLTRTGPASNSPVKSVVFGWDDDVEPIPCETLDDCVSRLYRVFGKDAKTKTRV